jgi:hypothetical protein
MGLLQYHKYFKTYEFDVTLNGRLAFSSCDFRIVLDDRLTTPRSNGEWHVTTIVLISITLCIQLRCGSSGTFSRCEHVAETSATSVSDEGGNNPEF